VACEFKSYRQAIAAAFRLLRSDLVECFRLTRWVEVYAPSWVELYPGHVPRSVVSLHGRRSTIEELQLSDLLHVVDGTNGTAGAAS
jgi:hypothetical protein